MRVSGSKPAGHGLFRAKTSPIVAAILLNHMKTRIGLIVTSVVCLGLCFMLSTMHKQASERTQQIQSFSNEVVKVTEELDRQKQVNTVFEKDLETKKQAFAELTNSYSSLSATLAQTEDTLKTTQQEVVKRDTRISELETENQALDTQALELSAAITNLTLEIAETQRKLAVSEGDKAFLEAELKRLMSQKAALERQFNDLSVLRAQVAKLKREQSIARRIEWNRRGLLAGTEQKGAQRLLEGVQPAENKTSKPAGLNVEVNAEGSVKVTPPTDSTAAPPAK